MRTLILAAAFALMAGAAGAQGFHRTELERQAFPPGFETVTVRTVVDAGAAVAPHIHPGAEMGYILAGEGTLRIEGQPERKLQAGDAVMMPIRAVHSMTNTGKGELVILSTYVVEAGQPIAIMAK